MGGVQAGLPEQGSNRNHARSGRRGVTPLGSAPSVWSFPAKREKVRRALSCRALPATRRRRWRPWEPAPPFAPAAPEVPSEPRSSSTFHLPRPRARSRRSPHDLRSAERTAIPRSRSAPGKGRHKSSTLGSGCKSHRKRALNLIPPSARRSKCPKPPHALPSTRSGAEWGKAAVVTGCS